MIGVWFNNPITMEPYIPLRDKTLGQTTLNPQEILINTLNFFPVSPFFLLFNYLLKP